MKNTVLPIWMIVLAIALSLQSSAFDPLPSGCVNHCSSASDCMVCISACEGYISNYADINVVRSSILRRESVNTSGFDGLAVYNLESCWCSACCEYNYGGDSVHPCIYPCPCTIRNTTNNATTTTIIDKNRRPDENASFSEIKDSVNYNLCYLLNLLWIVIPGISALILMWAGSRYMTSEEDPSRRANARNIMAYALTGLVLSLVACPAVDYLIVNTNITPFSSSCKCYEAIAIRPGVPPTLPFIANVTTQPFVQTTHVMLTTTRGSSTTTLHNGTTTSTTTSTTLGCSGPCEEYKRTHVLPKAFDWRNVSGKNYMTRIRDQSPCGSCWAHAVCASMEGTYNVEKCMPSELNLAEQDLVSCTFHTLSGGANLGCNGGNPWVTFTDYLKNTPVTEESCFPYKGRDPSNPSQPVPCSQKCADWRPKGYSITSLSVQSSANSVKADLICGGPFAVVSPNWHHAITLVGYDDDSSICKAQYNGKPGCWIIKNSWGLINGMHPVYHVYHVNGYGYIPYSGHSYSDIINSQYAVMPSGPRGIKH